MSKRMMQDTRLRLVILGLLVLLFVHCGSRPADKEEIKGLKDYYKAHFLIGAALFPELFDDPIS